MANYQRFADLGYVHRLFIEHFLSSALNVLVLVQFDFQFIKQVFYESCCLTCERSVSIYIITLRYLILIGHANCILTTGILNVKLREKHCQILCYLV